MRFGVLGVTLGQPLLLLARRPQAQLLRDLLGDLLLHRDNLGELPDVLPAPELRVGRHVHQLGLDIQAVAALHHSPRQHRPHIQLPPDLFGICFAPLVAKHPAPWHHPQLG